MVTAERLPLFRGTGSLSASTSRRWWYQRCTSSSSSSSSRHAPPLPGTVLRSSSSMLIGVVRMGRFGTLLSSWPVLDPTDQPIKQTHDATMLQKSLSDSKIMRRDVTLRSMPQSRPRAVLHIRPKVMIQTECKRGRAVSIRLC